MEFDAGNLIYVRASASPKDSRVMSPLPDLAAVPLCMQSLPFGISRASERRTAHSCGRTAREEESEHELAEKNEDPSAVYSEYSELPSHVLVYPLLSKQFARLDRVSICLGRVSRKPRLDWTELISFPPPRI